MKRYEVKNYTEGWGVYDHELKHVIAVQGGGLLESAAHIIAYALNAVAEGRVLEGWDKPGEASMYSRYDGPTEGVAA